MGIDQGFEPMETQPSLSPPPRGGGGWKRSDSGFRKCGFGFWCAPLLGRFRRGNKKKKTEPPNLQTVKKNPRFAHSCCVCSHPVQGFPGRAHNKKRPLQNKITAEVRHRRPYCGAAPRKVMCGFISVGQPLDIRGVRQARGSTEGSQREWEVMSRDRPGWSGQRGEGPGARPGNPIIPPSLPPPSFPWGGGWSFGRKRRLLAGQRSRACLQNPTGGQPPAATKAGWLGGEAYGDSLPPPSIGPLSNPFQ